MKSDDVKCIADYARFISDTYVELDTLRYTTVQKPVHEIAEFMIMSWPVIQGGKKQAHAEDLRKAAWYLTRAAEALEE